MAMSRRRLIAFVVAFSISIFVYLYKSDITETAFEEWQPDLKQALTSLTPEAAATETNVGVTEPVVLPEQASATAALVPVDGRPQTPKHTLEPMNRAGTEVEKASKAAKIQAEADQPKSQAEAVKTKGEQPQAPQESGQQAQSTNVPEMIKRPDGHVVVLSEQEDQEKGKTSFVDSDVAAAEEMKKEEARRKAEAERKEALEKADEARQAEEQKKAEEAAKIEAARVAQEEKELAWEAAETGKHWGKYEDVAIIIRTGFQVQKRLEGPLSTYLRDRKEDTLAIFSDRESEVMDRKVHDTIKPFFNRSPATYNDTNMRKIYDTIQAMNSDGTEVKPGEHNEGWKLDIMKQTMSADLGYQMLHKNRKFKWWAIIDDDTYLHLPTLSTELAKVNHSEAHYFGSPTWCGGTHFAHGGSGIVLSAKAMSDMFDNRTLADRMHANGLNTPYGDHNLAVYLKEIAIPYENQFRHSFHGDPLEEVRFKLEQVCAPLFTLHHLQETAMKATHEIVFRDRLVRFWDVLDAVADFKDMSLWYKEDHSYNLWVKDDLALESEVGKDSDKRPEISEKMPVVKIDSKHDEKERSKLCENLCHSGEMSKGCITWTYIPETRDCYMADWFMLNTGRPRKGAISGILAERLSEWRRAPCYW